MKIFCVGRNYVAHAKELGNEDSNDLSVVSDYINTLEKTVPKMPPGRKFILITLILNFKKALIYNGFGCLAKARI